MIDFNEIQSRLGREGIALSLVDISSVRESVERGGMEPFLACFSPGENARAESMRFIKRKSDFISGRLAAKLAVTDFLSRHGDVGCASGLDEIDIQRKDSGEPAAYFRGAPLEVSVSISHAGSLAVSGVSGGDSCRAIGIDIEKIEVRDDSFSEIAFTDGEIEELYDGLPAGSHDAATLSEEITRYWTIKESVMKSMGIGLNIDLKDIEVRRNGSGEISIRLFRGALERFRELGCSSISVENFTMDGYVLSVARME